MQPQTQMALKTASDMHAILVEKSLEDSEFRQRLIADPKAVTSEEFGITLSDAIKIQVHESDKYTFHVSLPPSNELDEEQLEMIAAGLCCC